MQKRQAPLKQLRQRSPEVFASKLVRVGFPGALDGKDSTCNEGDVSSFPWTEEPGGLQSMGLQELNTTK